jgi:hypothetical protein
MTQESIFSSKIKTFNGKWEANPETSKLTPKEVESVQEASVVPLQFGLSICFALKSGQKKFIPLSRDSQLSEGEVIDPSEVEITTLHRLGSEDIYRADVVQ